MSKRSMRILVVAALAVILTAVPAYAGQAGALTGSATQASVGGGAQVQTQAQEQVQSQYQTGECAVDCTDCTAVECVPEQVQARTRTEARVSENAEPVGDAVRERTRDRISQPPAGSEDASAPADPDPTSVTESGTPEPPVEPAARAMERVMHSVPAGVLAWVRSMLALIGLA